MTRYLSLDVAYQTIGHADVTFAPRDQILQVLNEYKCGDPQWKAKFRQCIHIHRLDVVTCLPKGTLITKTSSIARTQYLLDALSKLGADPTTHTVIVEEQPELNGMSRNSSNAFYTILSYLILHKYKVITVPPSAKNTLDLVFDIKSYRKYMKSIKPNISGHEIAKEFSKVNLKTMCLLFGDDTILGGVGDNAKIRKANLDDAADAFIQALVYHLDH